MRRFSKCKKRIRPDQKQRFCLKCKKKYNRRYYLRNRAKLYRQIKNAVWRRRGVTDFNAVYAALFEKQKGRCAICGNNSSSSDKMKQLVLDHCHTKRQARGLLCQRCNLLLGNARDSVEILTKAINYLKHEH